VLGGAETQLTEEIKTLNCSQLQLDESADIANISILDSEQFLRCGKTLSIVGL
jgi:hypothetical protein